MTEKKNPIKVIQTDPRDFKGKDYAGFSKPKPHREVSQGLVKGLLSDTEKVQDYFTEAFSRWPDVPAVAKVTLNEKAIAKSHRPTSLLNPQTCPVIGSLALGELLVGVTSSGLKELRKRLAEYDKFNSRTVHVSAIDKIEPYSQEDVLKLRDDSFSGSAIVRIFNHHNREINRKIQSQLEAMMASSNWELQRYRFGKGIPFYEIRSPETLFEFAAFQGVRSIAPMPRFTANHISLESSVLGSIDSKIFPGPDPERQYPLVGIIDSGIDPTIKELAPWVWDRLDLLDGEPPDYEHGSMVAGLVVNARALNHGDIRFPECSAEIVDVAAFPKGKSLSLPKLMSIVQEAVHQYPDVRIWNLSLSAQDPCDQVEFSELSHFLNELSDDHGCLFVIASGNYTGSPLRTWPSQLSTGLDRLASPGDAVRGLTVGSLAHRESHSSLVKTDEPSPFSRCGPGPSFTPKPEVTHFGGNCDQNGSYQQTGILSIGAGSKVVESVGTSFATPLVATLAADTWHQLDLQSVSAPTSERVKALLVHSSLLDSAHIDDSNLNYYGFGRPSNTQSLLNCNDHDITYLFEVDIKEGEVFERTPFAMPSSMFNDDGKFVGEVILTLVYSPPLDFSFPSEYCRRNVDVSFGKYELEGGKWQHRGVVPQVREASQLYEKALVENGYKWSPVKVYKRTFPRGVQGSNWRLKMECLRRAESDPLEHPQRSVLLMTFRALADDSPVYADAVTSMQELEWQAVDLVQEIPVRIKV